MRNPLLRPTFILLGIIASFVVLALLANFVVFPAMAQDQSQAAAAFDAICAHKEAVMSWLAIGLSVPVVASVLANAEKYMPSWAIPIVHFIALNWFKLFQVLMAQVKTAKSTSALIAFMLIGALLAACQDGADGQRVLTPAAQNVLSVLCTADLAAPAVVKGVSGVVVLIDPAAIGPAALANQADTLAHPVVQSACAAALSGSVPAQLNSAPAPPAATPVAGN